MRTAPALGLICVLLWGCGRGSPPVDPVVAAESEAKKLYSSQQWEGALEAATDGLAKVRSATLERIAQDCRSRLAAAKVRDGRIQRRPELKAKVDAVEAVLARTRGDLYKELPAVERRLAETRVALADLQIRFAADRDADYAEVWKLIGTGWILTGDGDRAEEALLRSFTMHDADGMVHFLLGRLYVVRSVIEPGQWKDWNEKALKYLQRESQEWSGAGLQERRLAAAYLQLAASNLDEAEKLAREGLGEFGGQDGVEEFWVVSGMAKRGTDAISAYGNALARCPAHAWACFMRGSERRLLGELKTAVEDFTVTIRLNPRMAEAYVNRGMAAQSLGDARAARADYEQALQEAPKDWSRRKGVETLLREAGGR